MNHDEPLTHDESLARVFFVSAFVSAVLVWGVVLPATIWLVVL